MATAKKKPTLALPVLLVKERSDGTRDYRRFTISRFKAFSTLNGAQGRLYADRHTMRTTDKAYPTFKKAQERITALVRYWGARGFHRVDDVSFVAKPKKTVVYDKAKWHSEGDYPQDLPPDAAATHIGMFLAWCVLSDRASEELLADLKREVNRLKGRAITPGAFLLEAGESLVSDQLNDLGNAFAAAYYNGRGNDSRYYEDYQRTFRVDDDAFYRVPDSWKSFDRLKPVIARRHETWLASGKPKWVR